MFATWDLPAHVADSQMALLKQYPYITTKVNDSSTVYLILSKYSGIVSVTYANNEPGIETGPLL